MVNDIKRSVNTSLLAKFAEDITVSVPVRKGVDDTAIGVDNILQYSTRNGMRLSLEKAEELVLKRNIGKPDPPIVSGIQQV